MVSVLMSVYKESQEYLKLSIESILNQTMRNFEYLIVIDEPDNHSAIELIEKYASIDNRIKIFVNEKNIGLSQSLNRALSFASKKYVARMDADDISELNRFEIQMKYLEENDLDLVGCSLRRISETGEIVYKRTNKSYCTECISKLLMYDDCVPHPSWFGKKELFDKLGGYRELKSCEDYDFLLRARHLNARVGIVDFILLNYRINLKGISRSNSLKQMLSSHYLQLNYDRIGEINQNEIDSYLKDKIVKNNAEKYEHSVNLLNKSIEYAKNRRVLLSVLNLFKAVFSSKFCLININKIMKMMIIKKQYH